MGRKIEELHPELQLKLARLKKECATNSINIMFSECLRTMAEQDALYAQGRTTPGNIVTNARGSSYSSQHQWGIAADFYLDMDVDGDGSKSDDAFNDSAGLFERVGAIAKSIGLGWGGDWTSPKDRPHLYLPDWGKTPTQLKRQYGTPERFMATWTKGATQQGDSAGYKLEQFVRDVQAATGSKVDGIAGNETIGNTVTISESKNRKHPVVITLQKRLNALGHNCGTADGIAGPKFTAAVNSYQKNVLIYKSPDGEVTAGRKMWKSLLGMI